MTSTRHLRNVPGGADRKPLLTVVHPVHGQGVDLWVGSRQVLRLSRRRAVQIYGPLTVLRAHRGGLSVRKAEVRPWTWPWLRTVCGVLVCTPRGSAMLQWRGFPQGRVHV